jgi:gliding motility-associated-like protein
VNPAVTTTYSVTITDGCESTPLILSTEVVVSPLPIPLISTLDSAICEPASFTITSNTDASMVEHLYWSISDGQTYIDQESISTELMPSGIYSVQLIVTTPDGCVDSTTFANFLTVYSQPVANFNYNPNPVKMFNTEVNLTNYSSNGETYEWYIEEGSPSYSQQEHVVTTFPDGITGEYDVMLITTSEFGCIDTAQQTVIVLPEIILYAPNTFTPDGDEFNQQWGIFIEGVDIFNFNLKIFNRWGQMIWESLDPSETWDGTYNGEIVQYGTYTWTIEAKDLVNDAKYNFNGHINVLR